MKAAYEPGETKTLKVKLENINKQFIEFVKNVCMYSKICISNHLAPNLGTKKQETITRGSK